MLIWLIHSPSAVTINVTASRWLTKVDKNTETGTISAGKTVLVIRLAWSSRDGAHRCTVSLNSSQGNIPAKMYSEYFSSPAGAAIPRQIWKTNTQLSSSTSG